MLFLLLLQLLLIAAAAAAANLAVGDVVLLPVEYTISPIGSAFFSVCRSRSFTRCPEPFIVDDPSDKSLAATSPPLTRRTGECGHFALFTKPPPSKSIAVCSTFHARGVRTFPGQTDVIAKTVLPQHDGSRGNWRGLGRGRDSAAGGENQTSRNACGNHPLVCCRPTFLKQAAPLRRHDYARTYADRPPPPCSCQNRHT